MSRVTAFAGIDSKGCVEWEIVTGGDSWLSEAIVARRLVNANGGAGEAAATWHSEKMGARTSRNRISFHNADRLRSPTRTCV